MSLAVVSSFDAARAEERADIVAWLRDPKRNGLETNHARKCAEYYAACLERGAHRPRGVR